ncbi:MAG: hypothetical protein LOD91_07885, partial [Limnochordales bacterium]
AARQAERRLQEAAQLGFQRCVLPRASWPGRAAREGIEGVPVAAVAEALWAVGVLAPGAGERR